MTSTPLLVLLGNRYDRSVPSFQLGTLSRKAPVEVQPLLSFQFHQNSPLSVDSMISQSIEPESSMPKITLGLASTDAFSGSSARLVEAAPAVAAYSRPAVAASEVISCTKVFFHGNSLRR